MNPNTARHAFISDYYCTIHPQTFAPHLLGNLGTLPSACSDISYVLSSTQCSHRYLRMEWLWDIYLPGMGYLECKVLNKLITVNPVAQNPVLIQRLIISLIYCPGQGCMPGVLHCILGVCPGYYTVYWKYSQKYICYAFVTNWGKTGLGLGERPASETGSTDDGLFGHTITDTIRWWYIMILMINNSSVIDYDINRSQPVTLQCPIT